MRTRIAAAALAAAALLALAACSSSDDDNANPPTFPGVVKIPPEASQIPDKAALSVAVKAYSTAYFKPDPAAAGKLLSDRCRDQTSAEAYKAELTQAVANFGHQDIKSVTVDQISGDLARVTYTYSVPALDQHGQPWVREGGAWHYDAC
jgi:hypothetical protein